MSLPYKTDEQAETLKGLLLHRWDEFVVWLAPAPKEMHADLFVKAGDNHWRIEPDGKLFEIDEDFYAGRWAQAFRYALERK